jgi:hypothetical protein
MDELGLWSILHLPSIMDWLEPLEDFGLLQ